MAFDESFLRELAERNDIEDVVSGYVRLVKRSGGNVFGLCPFHSEKTPSFSVSPDKQIYHCFGCGKGGSVISFIMEIENLSYPDAVYFLARRANMTVPEDRPDEMRPKRERMLKLNRDAARFFYDCLFSESGSAAAIYLDKRGISRKMATAFGLGAAPDAWDALIGAMTAKGYTQSELLDAGLARRSTKTAGGVYDTFRDRLMFPVIDVRSQVIGFSGRALGDFEPKYMNSPETLVFNKSRNLFALNLAKKTKSGYILLVEGNIDVVTLHQAGFDSAVASLGTSLTAEQARLISRYSGEVILAYDSDGAGLKASERAIGILDKLNISVRVLRMPGAKDPDEFIRQNGAEAFRLLVERSGNHIEYRLTSLAAKYNLEADDDRVKFLKDATELLAELISPVERDVYAARVAELASVSKEAVSQEARRARRRREKKAEKSFERQLVRPGRSQQPKEKSLRYENVRSAAAEEGVVRLIYLDPALCRAAEGLKADEFSSEFLGRAFDTLLRAREAEMGAGFSLAALSEHFTPDEISRLSGILQKPERLSLGEKAMKDYIAIIKSERTLRSGELDFSGKAEAIRKTKGYGG